MPYTSEHYHFQPRIPHPDKIQINHMDKIKTFADVHNFNIFTSSESSLRELLIHCSMNEGGHQKRGRCGTLEGRNPTKET